MPLVQHTDIPDFLLLLFQGGVARADSLFLDMQIGSNVQKGLDFDH